MFFFLLFIVNTTAHRALAVCAQCDATRRSDAAAMAAAAWAVHAGPTLPAASAARRHWRTQHGRDETCHATALLAWATEDALRAAAAAAAQGLGPTLSSAELT